MDSSLILLSGLVLPSSCIGLPLLLQAYNKKTSVPQMFTIQSVNNGFPLFTKKKKKEKTFFEVQSYKVCRAAVSLPTHSLLVSGKKPRASSPLVKCFCQKHLKTAQQNKTCKMKHFKGGRN